MLKYKLIKMRAIVSFVFKMEGNVHETCVVRLLLGVDIDTKEAYFYGLNATTLQ